MRTDPAISVLMPVYNTEKYLKEAIESVINQTFKNWELICVNDGSIDGSLEILLTYQKLDSRIQVYDQINMGTASAVRNVALKYAKGEFVQMLDSDDLLSNDCLELAYSRAISTNADFILPDLLFFKEDIKQVYKKIIGYEGKRNFLLNAQEAFLASLDWRISGVGLYRALLLKRFGYDETGMNGDEYTTRLLLLNCNKIGFCKGQYFYRQHLESTTKSINIGRFETLLTKFRIIELAIEYKVDSNHIYEFKKKILNAVFDSFYFFIHYKNEFSLKERNSINKILLENFNKIDKTFIVSSGNRGQFIFQRVLISNFYFFKSYVQFKYYIIPIFKKILR